jgi:hypothetical protein
MGLGRNLLGLAGGHPILGLPDHSAELGVFVDLTSGDHSGFTRPNHGERTQLGRLTGIEHRLCRRLGRDEGGVTAEPHVAGTRGTSVNRSDLLTANGLPEEFDFAPIIVGHTRGATRKD